MENLKTRLIEVISYPDSEIPKLIDDLKSESEHWLVSPLHDKDTNEDGEFKKAHRHIYFVFKNPRYLKAVQKELCTTAPCVNKVKGSANDCYLYSTHANAPDKYQYDVNDIECDSLDYWQSTNKDDGQKYVDMLTDVLGYISPIDFIRKYGRDGVFLWSKLKDMADDQKIWDNRYNSYIKPFSPFNGEDNVDSDGSKD